MKPDCAPAEVAAPPKGPRSEAVHIRALCAAGELLKEGGLKAATVEAIADRSGVSKVTLYRHWPSRHAIAAEAFGKLMEKNLSIPRTDYPVADLRQYLDDIGRFYSSQFGEIFAELVGACANDPTTAAYFQTFFLNDRRQAFSGVIERCVEVGYFRSDIDLDEAIDIFFGPLVYRKLVGHVGIDSASVGSIVEHGIRGLRAD